MLAAWLELEGLAPVVIGPAEDASEALARVRPPLALVDVDHPDGGSRAMRDAASGVGAAVLLYSPAWPQREVARVAAGRGLRWLELPESRRQFVDRVRTALRHPTAEIAEAAANLSIVGR